MGSAELLELLECWIRSISEVLELVQTVGVLEAQQFQRADLCSHA